MGLPGWTVFDGNPFILVGLLKSLWLVNVIDEWLLESHDANLDHLSLNYSWQNHFKWPLTHSATRLMHWSVTAQFLHLKSVFLSYSIVDCLTRRSLPKDRFKKKIYSWQPKPTANPRYNHINQHATNRLQAAGSQLFHIKTDAISVCMQAFLRHEAFICIRLIPLTSLV